MDGTSQNIILAKIDILYFPSIHDLEDRGDVVIHGEVAKPDSYPYEMCIRDSPDSIVTLIAENPEMEPREGWIEVRLMDQMSTRIIVDVYKRQDESFGSYRTGNIIQCNRLCKRYGDSSGTCSGKCRCDSRQ